VLVGGSICARLRLSPPTPTDSHPLTLDGRPPPPTPSTRPHTRTRQGLGFGEHGPDSPSLEPHDAVTSAPQPSGGRPNRCACTHYLVFKEPGPNPATRGGAKHAGAANRTSQPECPGTA
jgi:hypothetical protein